MTRKLNIWEQRVNRLLQAQKTAQKAIERIEKGGAIINDDLKKLATKSLNKSRYSDRETKNLLSLLNTNYIKSRAKRPPQPSNVIKMNAYNLHQNIKNVPRYEETYKLRPGKEAEDFSRKLIRDMKYSLRYRPSLDAGAQVGKILRTVGYKPLVTEELDTLSKISTEEFIAKFTPVFSADPSQAFKLVDIFYKLGRSSPEAFTSKKQVDLAQSKTAFGENATINGITFSADKVDSLYSFFKNSKVWYDYRKKQKPSDDADYYENFSKFADKLSSGEFTTADVDALLMKGSAGFKSVVDNMIITKIDSE